MHAKFYPFFKISRTHACKMTPFFLISRIRASHWKNTLFFAKMDRSVVYVLVGSVCVCVGGVGGGGGGGGGGWGWGWGGGGVGGGGGGWGGVGGGGGWGGGGGISQECHSGTHIVPHYVITIPAWCDDMETPSLLLLLCERNPSIISGFPHSQEE